MLRWLRAHRLAIVPAVPPPPRPTVFLRISALGTTAPLLRVSLDLLEAMALAEPGGFVALSTDELRPGTVVQIIFEHQ